MKLQIKNPSPRPAPAPNPASASGVNIIPVDPSPRLLTAGPQVIGEVAGQVAGASTTLGLPDLTQAQQVGLVVVIDPKVTQNAGLASRALANAPLVQTRSGETPAQIEERIGQIAGARITYALAQQGEQSSVHLGAAVGKSGQVLINRLSDEINAELARLPADSPERLLLATQAAEFMGALQAMLNKPNQLRADAQGEAETSAGEVQAQEREQRILGTLIALQTGTPVSPDDAQEALDAYDTLMGDVLEQRITAR